MDQKGQIQNLIQSGQNDELGSIFESSPILASEKTEQGISYLTFASYCRNQGAIDLILNYKTSIDIFESCAIGSLEKVENHLLGDKKGLNDFSVDGFTPVGLASFFGHLEIVQLLIKAGANVKQASNNSFKVAPIHSACAINHVEITKLLLENGADVNQMQQEGVTPLHTAAHNGNLEMIKLLLAFGAERNLRTANGQTAFDMAKEKQFLEATNELKDLAPD